MPTTLEELASISAILSAAHHRSKNQHRLSKWWKAFCVLGRNVSKLVAEMEKWDGEVRLVGETKWTIASREVVERRADFMLKWVVPKCYLAFSGLVADNQFANLGLMLVGMLARIRKLIQPFAKEVEDEVMEDGEKLPLGGSLARDDEFDFGEVVSREDVENIIAKSKRKRVIEEDDDSDYELQEERTKKKKKKKKKKK